MTDATEPAIERAWKLVAEHAFALMTDDAAAVAARCAVDVLRANPDLLTDLALEAGGLPSRDDVREQTRGALEDVGEPFSTAQVNRVANAVMLLLSGKPKYEVDQ